MSRSCIWLLPARECLHLSSFCYRMRTAKIILLTITVTCYPTGSQVGDLMSLRAACDWSLWSSDSLISHLNRLLFVVAWSVRVSCKARQMEVKIVLTRHHGVERGFTKYTRTIYSLNSRQKTWEFLLLPPHKMIMKCEILSSHYLRRLRPEKTILMPHQIKFGRSFWRR